MNIVIPTADYPPIEGGIGTVSLQLSRELAALGHSVTVIAPYFEGMTEFDAQEPCKVIRFAGYEWGWFRFAPMMLKGLPWMRKADLVLGINIAYGGVMAWLLRKPSVTFAYAYEFLKFRRNPIASTIFRRVYSASRLTVSISHFTTEKLEQFGVPSRQIVTIFPGAPSRVAVAPAQVQKTRERYAKGGHLLLSVGRFVPRKGQERLIRAMPKILTEYPHAQLVFVGQGPRLEAARELTEELALSGPVCFTGKISDEALAALYEACDLFVLPTGEDEQGQVEGFGLVFTEAHAYGKPVVAGRSGGVVDAVLDGETGMLIDPQEPESIAEAVCALLKDDALARSMGDAGKRRVTQELNWSHFTQRMMENVEARL